MELPALTFWGQDPPRWKGRSSLCWGPGLGAEVRPGAPSLYGSFREPRTCAQESLPPRGKAWRTLWSDP